MRPGAEHRGAEVNAPGLPTFVIEAPLQGVYTDLLGRRYAERHNAWKTGLEDASKGIGLIRGLHPRRREPLPRSDPRWWDCRGD